MKRRTSILLFLTAVTLLLAAHIADATASEVPMENDLLTGTEWWVEDIGGGGVIDNSHTTVRFVEAGRVAGDTGCNRYMGSYEMDETALKFGPLAGTRRACIPALMDQEAKFYAAMARVTTWEVAETGLLHLRDADGETVIRAARVSDS
ncbi:MAG: META domain-containing protein [Gammaproteobacteria bacterium]